MKNDAYGEVNEDAIVDLPKHVFLVDGHFDDELIAVGNAVPMMSSNGQRMNGIVLAVSDDEVKMDFNHPLAGEDSIFQAQFCRCVSLRMKSLPEFYPAMVVVAAVAMEAVAAVKAMIVVAVPNMKLTARGAQPGGCGCGC